MNPVPVLGTASVASLLDQGPLDRLERRLLLAKATGFSREAMARAPETLIDADALRRYHALIERRLKGEPIAYLVGEREFYGRSFSVDARVLIPRPETELLIDLALEALAPASTARILDVGCGSGAIAVTLQCERQAAKVWAIDVSQDALLVAHDNAARHGAKVHFEHRDLRQLAPGQFDLIVANLPYIAVGDAHLDQGDLRFEPRMALTDEDNGLSLLASLCAAAQALLAPAGLMLLEHGFDQARAVRDLLTAAGLEKVATRRDLAGIERVSQGTKNP